MISRWNLSTRLSLSVYSGRNALGRSGSKSTSLSSSPSYASFASNSSPSASPYPSSPSPSAPSASSASASSPSTVSATRIPIWPPLSSHSSSSSSSSSPSSSPSSLFSSPSFHYYSTNRFSKVIGSLLSRPELIQLPISAISRNPTARIFRPIGCDGCDGGLGGGHSQAGLSRAGYSTTPSLKVPHNTTNSSHQHRPDTATNTATPEKTASSPSEAKKLAFTSPENTPKELLDDQKPVAVVSAQPGGETAGTLTLWQRFQKELAHYRDGTKLLVVEFGISTKLAMKLIAGYELSRRENRQLRRTVGDLGRLLPFSVFLIVPFAEFLLPVVLKFFPNLLPSVYEGQKAKDAKAANLSSTRKEVSSFIRQTVRESGLPVRDLSDHRKEFAEFFRKVRKSGENPSDEEVIRIAQIFKDDITLDNLSRPQLVAICRYMNLGAVGPDTFLRYQIRHRMRQIKKDDRVIAFEGVDSLTVPELQTACASRGLPMQGVSPASLREDLQTWLDLRLKYRLPSTLLVLSNAYGYANQSPNEDGRVEELKSQIDALRAVLSSIPEELFHEMELEVHTAEGAETSYSQRLEVVKEQQELIEEETEQHSGHGSVRDDQDIDEKEEESLRDKKPPEPEQNSALGPRKPGERGA